MSEYRIDLGRQDGHDPERDEYCATGLCEHERGPAFPRQSRRASSSVTAAFLGARRTRDDEQEGERS